VDLVDCLWVMLVQGVGGGKDVMVELLLVLVFGSCVIVLVFVFFELL